MLHIGKALRSASYTFAKNINCGNLRNFGTSNIWDMSAIGLLHHDFGQIQQLKEEQVPRSFIITEIPPPFCPKCNKYAKNKCSFTPVHDISIDDFDLATNPNLNIQCPIFGEVSTIFDNDVLDETTSPKDE